VKVVNRCSVVAQKRFRPSTPYLAARRRYGRWQLAADVAGYSRLMGVDEEGTLAQLKAHRQALVDPKITEHRGRIVKTTGDGMLVEFASVVDALRCAVQVQRGMAERNAEVPPDKRIEFRVGIHQGDIISDDGDIFGDGVNIAARLEGLAEPAGICVSSRVQEDAQGKLDITFENIGEQQLKNIVRPVRVYRVRLSGAAEGQRPVLPLPDKPSIAVLPFQNMSGDPEQNYFADGMVEDIITALSRFHNLFVIARNSSFAYKDRAVDVKQVGRELGVRYVLEGSVRKATNRVRIAGQLVDATTGAHLWADRFDGGLEDIFDLQDRITASVVGAITPKLDQAEIERAKRKPTESLDAYDYHLRAMASYYQPTRAASKEALRLFYKSIELDPDFASPHGWAAVCYTARKQSGWMADFGREVVEGTRLARRAVELGRDDAVALAAGGFSLAYLDGDLDAGATFIDRAIALNPNFGGTWHASGWVRIYLGEPDLAIDHLAHAMRLSPLDPLTFQMAYATALAHFFAGRDDQASLEAVKVLRELPNFVPALRLYAASCAMAGRLSEAQKASARARESAPALRVSMS
jgi:TolB-like protein/class 3 adenylate cyclase